MRPTREIDTMARELVRLIDHSPLCAVGLAELTEGDFLDVAAHLHRIYRARTANLEAQMLRSTAERAKEEARAARNRAKTLDKMVGEPAA